MLWKGRRESSNVEDRRGISGGKIAAGGGIVAIILVLANLFLGDGNVDLNQITSQLQGTEQTQLTPEEQALEDERAGFVKVVLADTEDVWKKIFAENGSTYSEPTLVLFRDQTESACGSASSAIGPFYCPGDNKLYIDLSFAEELKSRFGASGDFALAYVVAHEVGHHVQNLLGTSEKVARLRNQLSETEYNKYSVKLELQADFYAGVWAHYDQKMKNVLAEGDIEEALNAAKAVGDDNIQKQATGVVRPDAFTHGTSAQRMYWFKKGFETGDIKQGDTFNNN
ncbi:MAG: neutral zinc metallopeptidase [Ferruginibacter sp.]|nr:neutral zinc metallopeptidase [Ferruginibacter sp.]